MGPYFAFLSAILTSLGKNIAGIFTGRGFNVIEHFNGYHQIFLAYQADFGPAGWIFFVLMIVLAIVIVGGLAYLLILAFRKLRLRLFERGAVRIAGRFFAGAALRNVRNLLLKLFYRRVLLLQGEKFVYYAHL